MAKEKKISENTTPRNKVAKVVNLSVSVGDDDSERLLAEFVTAIKEALSAGKVNAKNITVTGQHYLILNEGSGKYCREADYDPATRDFKPGTFPPAWAGGGPETKRVERDISSGVGVGARNPEHLRTVEETLRARASKGAGKKLRMRRETAQGDSVAITRAAKSTLPDEDIELDLDAVESGAESEAESASKSLLLKLRKG